MRAWAPAIWLALSACGGPAWKQVPHDRPHQSVPPLVLHERPAEVEPTDWWYAIVHAGVRPLAEAANPGRWAGQALQLTEALDVNHFGQVIDSPWFTNRIGHRRLTAIEVAIGPNRSNGPADGPLLVLGGKLEGATPGLVVRDSEQQTFVLKFDPPAFPELSSGAEVIATKILWAAGYHVPENYVVEFELDRLTLAPDATTGGRFGALVPMTRAMLDSLISHVNPYPNGTIRALFSRLLPGEPLGPFAYRGQRADDPNDRFGHERRRSLRGLWLFAAWLNNVDTRASNTLDVFIPSAEDPALGHVEHYLIDFGDALGAAGTAPKYVGEGYEGVVDWPTIGKSFFSLGLWYRRWLPVQRSPYRAVGIYESAVFTPDLWRPRLPNPAFDEASALDTYWAASLIARYTPDQLAAAVFAAEYSEPGAREWVLRVLTERQFTILERAFVDVLPLEDPEVIGRQRLRMSDLAVDCMLMMPEHARYTWTAVWDRTGSDPVDLGGGVGRVPEADLAKALAAAAKNGEAFAADPFITVTWHRPSLDERGPGVHVHLRVVGDTLLPVGISRDVR